MVAGTASILGGPATFQHVLGAQSCPAHNTLQDGAYCSWKEGVLEVQRVFLRPCDVEPRLSPALLCSNSPRMGLLGQNSFAFSGYLKHLFFSILCCRMTSPPSLHWVPLAAVSGATRRLWWGPWSESCPSPVYLDGFPAVCPSSSRLHPSLLSSEL
jgi:hypothetical protein